MPIRLSCTLMSSVSRRHLQAPSLDNDGNLYFTHHFFKDNKMIEADIYMAPRKTL